MRFKDSRVRKSRGGKDRRRRRQVMQFSIRKNEKLTLDNGTISDERPLSVCVTAAAAIVKTRVSERSIDRIAFFPATVDFFRHFHSFRRQLLFMFRFALERAHFLRRLMMRFYFFLRFSKLSSSANFRRVRSF